jgi:regulatory protein
MAESDPSSEILERARTLLASREHSRLELRRKLQARGFDDGRIGQALDALEREGSLDESRFTELYLAERAAKGFGPVRIRVELREKGIDDDVIERHLQGVQDDWAGYLSEIYDRRFGSEPPSDRAEYARRGRFLEQRGFPIEMIRRVLRWPD